MKKNITLILFVLISTIVSSQNIGQQGDTLKNYTDINGFKQGFWQKTYYSGKIKYQGYFKNDKPIGEFIRYYENGRPKTIMNYSEIGNKAFIILYEKNGNKIASGNYVNSKKDSTWNFFFKDTILLLEENYIDGERVGLIRKFYTNAKVMDESYIYNGIRDSIWTKYYSDGNLMMQCNHVNGVRTGEFYFYYENGKPQIKGQYKNDLKQGKWTLYNEDGSIEKEFNFTDDVADNQAELDRQEQEMFEKIEREKGLVIDPEDYIENPEMYIRKSKQY